MRLRRYRMKLLTILKTKINALLDYVKYRWYKRDVRVKRLGYEVLLVTSQKKADIVEVTIKQVLSKTDLFNYERKQIENLLQELKLRRENL